MHETYESIGSRWRAPFAPVLSLIVALTLAGCAGTEISLPSVTESKTELALPGKVIWHDLITHTPEESRRFYETLFGWEFEQLGWTLTGPRGIDYTLIRHEGRLIGGMVDANQLDRPNPEALSQWVVVMSVDNIDAAVARVAAQGGIVQQPPLSFGDRGRLAIIDDAAGAGLALLETRDGDPADAPLTIGGFLWDEIWTNDVEGTTRFYEQLTGLESSDRTGERGGSYRLLSDELIPRMGVLPMPFENVEPTWVSYIRVEDADAIVRQVAALGGRVLIDVRQRDVGGEAALIADPSGAGIAIQTWTSRQDSVAGAAASSGY